MLLLPINFTIYACHFIKDPLCRTLSRWWIICMIVGSIFTVAALYIKITRKIRMSIIAQEKNGFCARLPRRRKDIVTSVSSNMQLYLTLVTFLSYPLYYMLGYRNLETTLGVLISSCTVFMEATLDPVLYLAFSSDFRKALMELIGSTFNSKNRESQESNAKISTIT